MAAGGPCRMMGRASRSTPSWERAGVSLGVSLSRQIPAYLFRESGTDARFSLETRHFDGLGSLSRLPLDRRCVCDQGQLERDSSERWSQK